MMVFSNQGNHEKNWKKNAGTNKIFRYFNDDFYVYVINTNSYYIAYSIKTHAKKTQFEVRTSKK